MSEHERWGDRLYEALEGRHTVEPPTSAWPGMSIEDAYLVSRRLLSRRLSAGEQLIGKKIGVTSAAVQDMLGVHQPDFGYLTDAMRVEEEMAVSRLLIQPRAEGEIAFVLSRDLKGPGITPAQVLAATESIHPCFEVVDSRIHDWKIAICDTIADNASSGMFVMGQGRSPAGFDFIGCRMDVTKNGKPLSRGYGSAALGSPLNCVAWLANTLGAWDIGLEAGEVILSGSLVPLEPVQAGDHMHVHIACLGATEVHFT